MEALMTGVEDRIGAVFDERSLRGFGNRDTLSHPDSFSDTMIR